MKKVMIRFNIFFNFFCLLLWSTQLNAAVDPLFNRYVAIGDSITHGFQSGSVDETRQPSAYPALLAQLMQTEFNQPLLKFPGYLLNIEDIGHNTLYWWQYYYALIGGQRTDRFKQQTKLNSFGITGADITTIQQTPRPSDNLFEKLGYRFFTLVLGEQSASSSALDQALARQPTFLTIWIGNNDILSAALWTDPSKVTKLDLFSQQFQHLVDRVKQTPSIRGVAIATIPDVASVAYLQETDSPHVPPHSLAAFWNVQVATGDDVLDPEEIKTIRQQSRKINEIIRKTAMANGWALFDAEQAFEEIIAQGYILRDAQGKPTDRVISADYLGALFSLDGVHPSTTGHAVIANYFSRAINETYGTKLGLIDEYAASQADTLYQNPYDPREFINGWEWRIIQFVLTLFM